MKLRNKKTGKIYKVFKIGLVWNKYGCPVDVGQYNSLAELNEEWEDVDGTNAINTPLIKDPKIRKAVRAWAEAMAIVYVERFDGTTIAATNDEAYISFDVDESVFNDVPFGRNLTIEELCGEEEE